MRSGILKQEGDVAFDASLLGPPLVAKGSGKGKRVIAQPPSSLLRAKGKDARQDDLLPPRYVSTAVGQVALPLALETRLRCKFRDGEYYYARVVERRKRADALDDYDFEYYVHWFNFNRRMDDWVDMSMMDLDSIEIDEQDEHGNKKGSKRRAEEMHDDEEHGEFDPNALREHEEFTKVKTVQQIELGRYELDTWYFSPLPEEYKNCKKLYFCEFTLAFFKRREQMLRHLRKCPIRHPPGDEIYRNGNVSMFEVDGRKERIYCQNLSYLAKLFLDHKTLYYDVDLFLFYILCECDDRGAHIVGYFSKEKRSEDGYNLACILTLPSYQRKGYGKFLISFSYELSKLENKVGTPERPLSDLGLVSYRGYWTRVILRILQTHEGTISIKDLSDVTCIRTDDILSTLQHLNLIQYQKGQHVIYAAPKIIEQLLKQAGSPGLEVDPAKIIWTPYDAAKEYASYKS